MFNKIVDDGSFSDSFTFQIMQWDGNHGHHGYRGYDVAYL